MKILLVNDDGFGSPGISALEKNLSAEHEIRIVAPDRERSISSHAISIFKPYSLQKVGDNRYMCGGKPADCPFIALSHIYKNDPVDLVISGINRGGNLAQDTYYSGTVAAAREASLNGAKSIAVSLAFEYSDSKQLRFDLAAIFLREFLNEGLANSLVKGSFLNINFPNLDLEKISMPVLAEIGKRSYEVNIEDSDGMITVSGGLLNSQNSYSPKSDFEYVAEGSISLTLMGLRRDNVNEAVASISKWLEGISWTEIVKRLRSSFTP